MQALARLLPLAAACHAPLIRAYTEMGVKETGQMKAVGEGPHSGILETGPHSGILIRFCFHTQVLL